MTENYLNMASETTGLWSYSEITGYWKLRRICALDNAETWLLIFKEDEPKVTFKLSKTKPQNKLK